MNDKSVVGPLLLGAALTGATGICLYLLLKKDEDFQNFESISARQTVLEVRIPKESSGAVIGRQGTNIREIQSKTNTRINFKDEAETETHKVLCIRGGAEESQLAEILIHQTIASQPRVETTVMYVPVSAIGAIIGRNGETVRSMQRTSKCKIDVARTDDDASWGKKKITLRGTSQQIELAKKLIEEKVKDQDYIINKLEDSKSSRIPGRLEYTEPLFLKYEKDDGDDDDAIMGVRRVGQEELRSTGCDDFLQVFVSAVSSPSSFWVQNVGPTSVGLDKLTQEMTAYYEDAENQKFHAVSDLTPGDIVATRYTGDNSFYRAKVVEFKRNEYAIEESLVDLDFVDYGDCEEKRVTEVFHIKPDFLRLNFQAIQCTLAHVRPPNSESSWPEESVDEFESLTHCAQWKQLWARIVEARTGEGAALPVIELFQPTTSGGDKNIGQELARLGLASYCTK